MDLKDLLAQRAAAWADMQSVMSDAEEAKRELTSEEEQKWDRAEERVAKLSKDIDRAQKHAGYESEARDKVTEDRERRGLSTKPEHVEDDEQRETEAFRNWMRYGMEGLDQDQRGLMRAGAITPEMRAQSIGTTTAGGFFVPPGYWTRISTALKQYGGLLNQSNVLTTSSGQPLQWPNNDDTSNVGALLSENTQVSEVDLTLGQRILNAWMYTSNSVLVSFQLLQDSAFDLDTWIPEKLGIRLGRILAQHFITGTGTSQPLGIAVAGTGYTIPVGKTGTTGQTLTVIYDDLVDLVHSIDPAYRVGPTQDPTANVSGRIGFLMNDASLAIIRKLKDSQQRPLWEPSVQANDPDRLLGYPVQIDQNMASMAANAYSIAFGNFHEGYVVRQVQDVQMLRLVERYADFLQVGFIAFARYDARPDNGVAFKFYRNSAT